MMLGIIAATLPVAVASVGPVETAYSGFKSGVYRLNGSTVTVADLWEHNASWDGWNSSSIVGGTGLPAGTTNAGAAMTSGALAVVSPSDAGFVAVLNLSVPATPGEFEIHLKNPDNSADGAVYFDSIDFIYAYAPNGSSYDQIYGVSGAYPAGSNKIAIKITSSSTSARTNGGNSLSATGGAGAGMSLLGITGFVSGGQTAVTIEDITFYPVSTTLIDALAA